MENAWNTIPATTFTFKLSKYGDDDEGGGNDKEGDDDGSGDDNDG